MTTGNKKQYPVKKRTYSPNKESIGVFDIETEGLGGKFIEGCVITEIGKYHFFRHAKDMLDFMLKHTGTIFYAHNGAKFDFLYIARYLWEYAKEGKYEIDTLSQGEKIIVLYIKKKGKHGKITLADSLPVMASSLENMSKALVPHMMKLKGTIDFDNGEVYDPSNEQHRRYLERDCDALYGCIMKLRELYWSHFQVPLKFTAGSTALHAWISSLPDNVAYFRNSPAKEKFLRKAFYGGFVFCGHSRKQQGKTISLDVNAAYARAMKQGVPVGTSYYVRDYFERNKPGIYHVIVDTPIGLKMPIIPCRDKNGLKWPVGHFETVITREEILFAEKRGYRFKVVEGVVFDRLEPIFDSIIDKCEQLEYPSDGSSADPSIKAMVKSVRNSLFGKFGTKSYHESIKYTSEVKEGMKPVVDKKSGKIIEGIYKVLEEVAAPYIHPEWASYITMWQRLYLFEANEAIGIENVYYNDTDSVKAKYEAALLAIQSGSIPTGDRGYGLFKIEKTYSKFRVLAPKNYYGIDEKTGKADKRAKGVPTKKLTLRSQVEAANGKYNPIQYDSLVSFRKLMENVDQPLQKKLERSVSALENSTAWNVEDDEITPKVVYQYPDQFQGYLYHS